MNDLGAVVLGAGFAGFGAAHRLRERGVSATVYEQRSTHGGHTSSHAFDDGFIFDEGPHISFTSDERLQALFAASVEGPFEKLDARVNNYWRGHWIKHPAQTNLHGLPLDLMVGCIRDFVAASGASAKIDNYEDWLVASFGSTFARTFPMQYGRKYHTLDAKEMTVDWLGPRLYRPSLEEVVFGALSPVTPNVHYVENFRYPSRGGFVSYLNGLRRSTDLRVGHKAVAIDTASRTLRFENGASIEYGALISSIPLPELIPLIKQAPEDVREAAAKLSCSEVVLVNIGLDRPCTATNDWTYFYDDDIAFARLSFPSRFSPNVTPPGKSAMQAEVYFSRKWKPRTIEPSACIAPVIEGLKKCGLVSDEAEIIHTSAMFAPYANVIFDHDRPRSLELVHGFLNDVGIHFCGRFGDWGYIWTDQAFRSGERAANTALAALES